MCVQYQVDVILKGCSNDQRYILKIYSYFCMASSICSLLLLYTPVQQFSLAFFLLLTLYCCLTPTPCSVCCLVRLRLDGCCIINFSNGHTPASLLVTQLSLSSFSSVVLAAKKSHINIELLLQCVHVDMLAVAG